MVKLSSIILFSKTLSSLPTSYSLPAQSLSWFSRFLLLSAFMLHLSERIALVVAIVGFDKISIAKKELNCFSGNDDLSLCLNIYIYIYLCLLFITIVQYCFCAKCISNRRSLFKQNYARLKYTTLLLTLNFASGKESFDRTQSKSS